MDKLEDLRESRGFQCRVLHAVCLKLLFHFPLYSNLLQTTFFSLLPGLAFQI